MEVQAIQEVLEESQIYDLIISVQPIFGGDINQAYRVETSKSVLFMKTNASDLPQDFFEKEALGLKCLTESKTFKIPQVRGCGQKGHTLFLFLEWQTESEPIKDFWEIFGEKLAALHQVTQPQFGLEYNNFIGSLPQINSPSDDWIDFFVERRLEPLWERARSTGELTKNDTSLFHKLCHKLEQNIPKEPPALLHGDLWSGNFIKSQEGPILIDPAVYYGHREMDLAMMHLFGGFSSEVFDVYHKYFPLEPGWKERIDLHNLYPLLVHTCLFGSSYGQRVLRIVKRFS